MAGLPEKAQQKHQQQLRSTRGSNACGVTMNLKLCLNIRLEFKVNKNRLLRSRTHVKCRPEKVKTGTILVPSSIYPLLLRREKTKTLVFLYTRKQCV